MKFRKFDHFLRNLDKKGKKRIWKRTVKFLTCVVVFVTTYALILPAITLESKAHCGESEHQHGDECYEIMKTLICKSEETEGHQHDENCSEKVRTLTCTNEDPEHEHSDSCYQEEAKLICSKEEQSAHHHSDECYKEEKKLVCDRKEHEHEELCYSDPEADLETSKDWKKSIEKIELTGNWADDAVKIAQSQIGVKESKDNFEIDEKTDEKKGISRYGQWYGKPYSDWSAFFTASCLYYSEMPDKDFPYIQDSVDKLVKELDKADYQLSNDFSDVQKGDLVFIANENTNKEDTYSHVGLVESVNEKKNELNLILGDWNNKVERKNFSKTDSSLAGTIRLPENPELNTEENDSEEKDESGRSEPSEDPEPEPDEEPEEDSVSETDLNSQTAAPKKAPARANAETETNNRDNSNQITPLEFNDETEKLNKDKHNLSLEYSSGETKYDSETKSISTQLTLNFNIENGTVNEKGEYILDLAEDLIVPGILNETHYFKYGDDNENGGQYTFVKCDDGHYQLRIKIDEKLVETSRKNQTDISGFITFSAKTDVKQNPDTGDVDLKVADDLNIDIPPKDIEMPDGESINYDLKTKKQGSISLQSNELIYKVNIDSINGTPDTIQVSDIMEALDQSGIKLSDLKSPVITVVQTTKKCDKSNNWVDDGSLVKGAEVKIDSSFNVQQGKLEFELPKLNSATEDPNDSTKKIVNGYYIEYRFKVKNLKEGSQVHVGNKITASSKDKITGEKVTSTDTDRIDVGKVDHNPDVLKKGSFNSEQEEITWTITINSNHYDAAGFEIRDDMFKEAIKDSLKLQPDNGIKPSIDDSGNPYFVIQPIENGINTHQYIITYKTKAQGSFNKKEVTNIVKVDKGDIHLTGKDTVNLENGWINKNADSHSEKNGIVTTTWTTTIGTDFGIIDNPFVIEDKWSENQWMSKDQVFEWAGKLNFNDQNNKPLPNISPFCPDPNKYTLTLFDKDGKQYDFQSIKENSDEISSDIRFSRFKIELKNLGETGKKTKRIVITYSTSAKPSDDKNLSIKLKNDVNVKDKNGSGEWTYLKNSDEKTGSADRDKIKWKIKSVVQHGQPINKITISDTLPDRLIFESISIKNLADPSYAASWEPSGNIVYSSANNKADYEITYDGNSRRLNLVIKSSGNQPLPEGSTFEIEYITKVDKDKFTPDDKGLYKEVFENQATVKRNDETDVSEIKAKVDWNYKEEINSKDKIDKQGLWNKDEQTIDYTIVINKDKKQISLTGTDGKTEIPAKLTVHDNLYYWQNESGQHVELLSNTVRLYKGDKVIRNANNNITNEPVDRKDWSWKYEATSDGGNRNNYLTAQVPNDGQSYILVYSYRISFDNPKIPGQTLSVKNTASISATGFQDTDDKTQTPWDKSDFSAGIGTGGFSITKIDSENGNEVLEGVEFTLFEYRDGSYFNTDIKFITNEKGRILIPSKPQKLNNTDFELKSNTAYYLMETKPHPGYIEEYNPRKIYFYYSDNQNKENNQIPSDFVGLDLAKGGHSEIISNIKQNTFTINKVDKDAAGNENSLEGAKFRVYQYDEDSKQFIETEKILTSNENGQVDIKWKNNDGFSYQFNRQYYIQEITPPNGYRLPKDPEKIYFGSLTLLDLFKYLKSILSQSQSGSILLDSDCFSTFVPSSFLV